MTTAGAWWKWQQAVPSAEVEALSWVIGHSSWPYRNAICNPVRVRKGMDQILLGCDWAVVCGAGVVCVCVWGGLAF